MYTQARIFSNSLAIPGDLVVVSREARDNAMNKPPPTSALDGARSPQQSQTLPGAIEAAPKIQEYPFMNRHARRQFEALERQRHAQRKPRPASKERRLSSDSGRKISAVSSASPPPALPTPNTDEYAMRLAMHFKRALNDSGQFRAVFTSGETPWTLAVMDPGLAPEDEQRVLEALPTPDPRFVALLEVQADRVAFVANNQRTEAVAALRELVQQAIKGPAAAPAKE